MVKRKRNAVDMLSTTSGSLNKLLPSPTSIFNEAVEACSRGKVPSMKDLNEYSKMKYHIELDKNLSDVKRVLKSNRDVISRRDPKTIHRLREKQSPNKGIIKDSVAAVQVTKRDFHEELEKKSEKGETYKYLLALDNADLVPNAEKIQCPACLQDVDIKQGATLQECLHSFCKQCLATAIRYSETALVRCPFQNDEYICESRLLEREVRALVTPEMYERYLQRSLAVAESRFQDSFHCKTPNCPGWCILEESVLIFECPICMKTNCLACSAIHDGMHCHQKTYDVDLRGYMYADVRSTRDSRQTESDRKSEEGVTYLGLKCKEKGTYQDLLALDDTDLVTNVEKFNCSICFSDIDVGHGVTLQDCLHSFCKECLSGVIQFSETAYVKCPFQNDQYTCESHLQDREIKALVTAEVYGKHLQKSVSLAESQAQDSFHCKTPDCPGWCFFEDDVNTFPCPVCMRTNCLTCAAIHDGKSCRQYQDDLIFKCDSNEEARRTKEYLNNVLENGTAMKCPQCQIIVMKKEGCDWLKCSMCQIEICWVTKGPRWGPKGLGDTSGGCRCKVDGKYCHPKCRNCH